MDKILFLNFFMRFLFLNTRERRKSNMLRSIVCSIIWIHLTLAMSGQRSCYDDQITCVRSMRQLLVDTRRFWFGSSYNVSCPTELRDTPTCANPDTSHSSIASRLFGLSDVSEGTALMASVQSVKLAFVTYNAPKGSVYACGHEFYIPAVSNFMVDPLYPTTVSSWSLRSVPLMAWDVVNNQTLYTVVVWDAGHFNLHGLYINCDRGSLDSGTVVSNYTGPQNPFPGENPYLVLVYPQTERLNETQVLQALQSTVDRNQGHFVPSDLSRDLARSLASRPSHVNIITLEADPYSVQSQREKLLLDNCPLLVSRLPALQRLIKSTNLSVIWSDDPSLGDNKTSFPLLSANLHVTYSTDDFETEYCCQKYAITGGMFNVDPFNDRPVRPGTARLPPRVQIFPINMKEGIYIKDFTYTLFMVDVAPSVDQGQTDPMFYTHWLVTNIKNGDVTTGDELSEYFGPNPIIPGSPRTYMFMLFKQPVATLNNSVIDDFCPGGRWICQIRLNPVLKAWNLTELVGVTWFRAQNDGFAKMRTYSVLKMQTIDEVCSDVEGFSNPCALGATFNTAPSTQSHFRYIITGIVVTSLMRILLLN